MLTFRSDNLSLLSPPFLYPFPVRFAFLLAYPSLTRFIETTRKEQTVKGVF